MKKLIVSIIGSIYIFILFSQPVFAENVAGSSGNLNGDKASMEKKKDFDLKVKKVKTFLESYDSPLVPFAKTFVTEAENNGLDWKLVVSISGVESTFGKQIPAGSFNGWGWGIPTGASSGLGFKDWNDGIATVSKGLKEKYFDKGLNDLPKIMAVYAPPSHSWAGNVQFFMDKLDAVSLTPELSI